MSDMPELGRLILSARRAANLSQAELAERAGTTQSAIARLEQADANPTIATLARTVAAAGYTITVELSPLPRQDPVVERYKQDVDRTLLRQNLRTTVDARLRSLGEWQVSLNELAKATKASRRKS